ncbi:hypothetical protein CHL76_00525 [Marinococcus halophilus]|uniref:Zn-dependent hydrolase n=1 Tax=Marinococcus halophilus TaxID=1371 RepID=A0A510Y406_MARHA|nr:MBL fold metallo-hydrolase [Marinococcus halophilus]OZT81616.1 hypothetical protein CHL76_00525 [Marinococcus halophilus]GEK57561.1 Zn-dependent hydrolase [Marinococcus halophilus]
MYLKYFYDTSLAQASYMIGCQATGEAAVIDPSRNIEDYLQIAREQGFRITGAFETHIHADFVSGVTELARRTGATIYYSTEGADNGGYEWDQNLPLHGVTHGEAIYIGNVKLRALHTPGHTPEHVSYELTDGAAADHPMGVFTGDFVFVGDVGRPDLLEKSVGVKDAADQGARQMFESLQRFKEYGDYMQIWPGHGAGSACGKALGAVPTSTVGYERMYNPAFQPTGEQAFVDFLLDGQSEPPAYFAKMKEVNKQAVTPVADVPAAVEMQGTGDEVSQLAEQSHTMVVDTRSAAAFALGSIPGTINLPYPGAFAEWMGRLADYEADIYLIAEPFQYNKLRRILTGMGMDRLKGFYATSVVASTSNLRTYARETPKQVEERRRHNDVQILDVRYQDEWDQSHVPDAVHVSLQQLPNRTDELSTEQTVAVHCASGKRSAIAASILQNHGFDVINVEGGFMKWKKEQLEATD